MIDVAGMPTSASSRVPDGGNAPADALAVARLRAAGAIVLGKTSTHEFALGVTTPQSRNPWNPSRLAGGSTGGSAIALASGMGLAALGTDTRASIRVPAALCGTVGYKATYGLIPTDGVVTLSWSMDHAAPMAKTVEDAAILLDVLTGSATHNGAAESYRGALRRPVAGMRVGVPAHGLVGASPAVAAACGCLRAPGVAVEEIAEPDAADFALANAAGLIVSRAEAAAYHAPWRERRDRYTLDVGEQLDEACGVSAIAYLQAQRYREDLRRRMAALCGRFEALALPTSKVAAPFPAEGEALLLALSENCVRGASSAFPRSRCPAAPRPATCRSTSN